MNDDREKSASSVKSARRVIELFEFFVERRSPAFSAAIADALDMPRSSGFALVGTLVESGYLYEVSRAAGYYPTERWLQNARVISDADPVVRTARPLMQRLRDETGETIILARRSANRVLYVDVVESVQPLRYSAQPGQLKPLHTTATGRAILGSMTEQERRSWFARAKPKARTSNTMLHPAKFDADIEAARQRGFYLTVGEHDSDVSALSCPAWLGGELYVIAIAGPTPRLQHRTAALGARLRAACAEWSR